VKGEGVDTRYSNSSVIDSIASVPAFARKIVLRTEIFDDAMESGSFISISLLTSSESSEVLYCLGDCSAVEALLCEEGTAFNQFDGLFHVVEASRVESDAEIVQAGDSPS
jgi:hypothetical protein